MSSFAATWLVLRALFAVGLFCHATTIDSAPEMWVWAVFVVAVWRLFVAFQALGGQNQ